MEAEQAMFDSFCILKQSDSNAHFIQQLARCAEVLK